MARCWPYSNTQRNEYLRQISSMNKMSSTDTDLNKRQLHDVNSSRCSRNKTKGEKKSQLIGDNCKSIPYAAIFFSMNYDHPYFKVEDTFSHLNHSRSWYTVNQLIKYQSDSIQST